MQKINDTGKNHPSENYEPDCLKGRDVLATRPLWEEVFSEDSTAFIDYYFQKKAPSNVTFVYRLLSSGEIVSMVHLTPYKMTIGTQTVPTYYIVGVATKASHRHRGLMAALLKEAFSYAESQNCPFVFLMPADPAIYEPFGFSYIYSRTQYDTASLITGNEVYIKSFPVKELSIQCLKSFAPPDVLSALSDFANAALSEQFDYYLTRTPEYYETLLAELESENGCIYVFTLHGRMEGYFLYAKEQETPFIQELLFSRRFQTYLRSHADVMSTLFPVPIPEKKPIIMAKNLSVPNHDHAPFALSLPEIHDYVNYFSTHKGMINEIV